MSVLEARYDNDADKMASVTSKSWTYFKRAHLHANGLGTSALVLILLLSYVETDQRGKRLVAIALGVGALGYSMFSMFAGPGKHRRCQGIVTVVGNPIIGDVHHWIDVGDCFGSQDATRAK